MLENGVNPNAYSKIANVSALETAFFESMINKVLKLYSNVMCEFRMQKYKQRFRFNFHIEFGREDNRFINRIWCCCM